jgi:hypothetical protein
VTISPAFDFHRIAGWQLSSLQLAANLVAEESDRLSLVYRHPFHEFIHLFFLQDETLCRSHNRRATLLLYHSRFRNIFSLYTAPQDRQFILARYPLLSLEKVPICGPHHRRHLLSMQQMVRMN